MKGLMGKVKGMPIKQLLFNHAEKVALATAGLFVLIALASTTWGGIDKQPEELMDKATKAGQALHTGTWPADEQAKFPESTYSAVAVSMLSKLANEKGRIAPEFAYDKPMSFPLYKRIEPRAPVAWRPVEMLIADASEMVYGRNPPMEMMSEEEVPEGEEGEDSFVKSRLSGRGAGGALGPMGPMAPGAGGHSAPKTSGSDKGKKADKKGKSGHSAAPDTDAYLENPMGGMAGGMGMSAGIVPRGVKFVAVRGIVDLDQTYKAIREALRLDQLDEARSELEFVDVKVQRQKAVAGPNPWLDANWEDVDIAKADEIFNECDLAPDIVPFELTDPVITMSLPARLDKDYAEPVRRGKQPKAEIVSHPFIVGFQLTKEQRLDQEKLIKAMQDEFGEKGLDSSKPKRRGFSGVAEDLGGMKRDLLSMDSNATNSILKRANMAPMGGHSGPARGGPKGMMGPGSMGMGATLLPMPSASSAMGHGAGGARMPTAMAGGPGMMGARPGQGAISTVGQAAVGYVMLFRYLDFDVTPGEAYRYRVQLVVRNPNFGQQLDKVQDPSDAEVETRETPWSEPTAPVVIKSDSNIFLSKVDERSRYRGEAEMKVYQWDPLLGTYIDGEVHVKPGQFVGGVAESDRLDLATPSLEKKKVLFASREFMLDSALPVKITPSEHPDLKLPVTGKDADTPTTLGAPSEVLVMNEYGVVHLLDSESSKPEMAAITKKVQDERKPWEELREPEKTKEDDENRLDGAGPGRPGAGPMMPMMGSGTSATKRKGRRGRNGEEGAMQMPMGGATSAPGYGPTKSKKRDR